MVAHKSERAVFSPSSGASNMEGASDSAGDSSAAGQGVRARHRLQNASFDGRENLTTRTTDSTAAVNLTPMQLTENALNPKKSLDELTKAGVIADNRSRSPYSADNAEAKVVPASLRPGDATKPGDLSSAEPRPITSYDKPKIEVGFTDSLQQKGKSPDLVVKADGSVQMLNNPEILSNGTIVVGLERVAGANNPTDAQQKAVSELYKYLDARLKSGNPAVADKGVELNNSQGLLDSKTASRTGARSSAGPDGSDSAAVQSGNRFSGNRDGGRVSQGDISDLFPGRDFQGRKGKVDALELTKDAVSSLNGSKGNYEHMGYRRGRGHAVGAYGLTADHFQNWLAGLDIASIEEQERKGLVPPGTAAKMKAMKEQLAKGETPDILKKMKEADINGLSDADRKQITDTFGKGVQEMAANDLINKYSQDISKMNGGKDVDPGQIALALHLGRVPNAEDMQDIGNQDYMSAARNKWQLAAAATQSGGQGFDYSGDANGIVAASRDSNGHAMWTRFAASVQGGRLGCAASVSEVLRNAGVDVKPDAGAYNLAQQLIRKGGQVVPVNQLRPGDVVYGGGPNAANGGGNAHIGIVEKVVNGQVYVGANSSSRGAWLSNQPIMNAFGRFVRNPGSQLYGVRIADTSKPDAMG